MIMIHISPSKSLKNNPRHVCGQDCFLLFMEKPAFTANISGQSRIAQALLDKIREGAKVENEEVNQIASIIDVLKLKRRLLLNLLTTGIMEELPADKNIKAIKDITELIAQIENEEQKQKPKQLIVNDKIDAAERKRIKETARRLLS